MINKLFYSMKNVKLKTIYKTINVKKNMEKDIEIKI